jgi:GMP synthase-like glutamine amidotransferase
MGSQPTPPPIRLAILECDTPVPAVQAKYNNGGYGAVFTDLFRRACGSEEALRSQLELSAHDVVNQYETAYPDPETLDAVLISGSKHNSFESDEWILRLVQYTRRLLEGGRVRIIGVCFGHQILARAMGTEVGRSVRGWELSVVEMNLTEQGKKIFGKDTLVSD